MQDVVGEVETFNYPRFVLDGFQYLGLGEGSASLGDGDGAWSDSMGDAVRLFTLQTRYCDSRRSSRVPTGGRVMCVA